MKNTRWALLTNPEALTSGQKTTLAVLANGHWRLVASSAIALSCPASWPATGVSVPKTSYSSRTAAVATAAPRACAGRSGSGEVVGDGVCQSPRSSAQMPEFLCARFVQG